MIGDARPWFGALVIYNHGKGATDNNHRDLLGLASAESGFLLNAEQSHM